MGFDLYGLSPQVNTPKSIILSFWTGKDGFVMWDKMDETDRDKYFKANNKHKEENPGEYYRSNVWWWRPMWEYICENCDDILSEKDKEHGEFNDGWKISKTKAKKIAARIRRLDKQRKIMEYELKYKKFITSLPLEECNICDGTGKRLPPPKTGAGEAHCNGCDGKGKRKHLNCHYPFESQTVIEFAEFCEQSGGFEIC